MATALILGYVWPEPTSSAAGIRSLDLVRLFQSRHWEVHFSSPSKENPHRERLEKLGVRTHLYEANDPAFDSFISELKPEVAVFDRFVMEEQFGWRVWTHSPRTARILDTQDLHFLRRARERALQSGASLEELAEARIDHSGDDRSRELGSIYRSDLTLVLSSFELGLLTNELHVPPELLALHRFRYPTERMEEGTRPSYEERRDFAMIGNFRHPPNLDAAFWLKREIWPRIRERLPDAEAHLYGAYPPREISELDDARTGFRVKGWAKDAIETLSHYRVSLAPLRFGAGIKGKLTDSWFAGTPVVTTPIGIEGMVDGDSAKATAPTDPAELALAASQLYTSKEAWLREQETGWIRMKRDYALEPAGTRLMDRIQSLLDDLEQERARNFVGQVLWHHSLRSTEFFSRWIEAKRSRLDISSESPL